VKKTGCLIEASNTDGRTCRGLLDKRVGGIASIWVLGRGGAYEGVEFVGVERERVGCWFRGGERDWEGYCREQLAYFLSRYPIAVVFIPYPRP
jgi:hypothetical protein